MKILVVAKLSDNSLNCILEPIMQLKFISNIYVLRDTIGNFKSEKVTFINDQNLNYKNKFRHLKKILMGIKICKKQKVNFIIGVLLYPHGYIGMLVSIITGLPYIHVTLAGQREFWIKGKLIEKFNNWIFRKSYKITVTGSDTNKYLISKGFDTRKIITLPNVINMGNYKDYNKIRDYDIVSVSRLDKNKNLSLLIKAIAKLKISLNLKAIIAGDGPELNNLISAARMLGVEENIQFPGWINEQEKNNIYNKATIFVLCSKGEGFPLSLLEAMACGCVPIVTQVGDISDVVVEDYNGFIIKNYVDENELVRKIEYLIKHPEKIVNMAVRAKEVKTKYSFNNVIDIWGNILT